jgi:hypothetical protein
MSIKDEVERQRREQEVAKKAKETEHEKKRAELNRRAGELEQHIKKQEAELREVGIAAPTVQGGRATLPYKHTNIVIDVGLKDFSAFVTVPKKGRPFPEIVPKSQRTLKDWAAVDNYVAYVITLVDQRKL